jgi:prolyl 4-hydroxylase
LDIFICFLTPFYPFSLIIGECEKNKAYMSVNCAPACQTCDKLDFENRCPFDPDAPQAWEKPGDLNRMFERITTDPYWETYGPISVISSPATTGGPWVLTLDNFLSDEECERLIETGYEEGYEISADVGKVSFDGTHESVRSEGRTSENAWCDDECSDDPITGPVQERIEKLSGIHYNNSEWLQLLKYEPGQFYMEHHDYIPHEAEGRPQGPRIMTVFLYLNDVEAGGGTRFGRMGVTVMPKKGRALIWPSVLDEDPSEMDEQTLHEALPVEAGVKYGANAWIHQRDFKTPFEENCV